MRARTIFKQKMATRTSVAVGLLVVAALTIGGVAVGAGMFWSDDCRNGQTTTSDSGKDDTVVATAGDECITLRELRESVLHLQPSKEWAERELQGLGVYRGQPIDRLAAMHNLLIRWGDDNVALSGLIHERIIYQKATELDYQVTDQELEENIEWARDAYERGEYDAYNQEWIDSLGADHYWDNIYPELAARSLAIDKLRKGVEEEVEIVDYVAVRPSWRDFQEEVIAAAEFTVLASEDHAATLDGVMGYWEELGEINRTHLRKDNAPPAAVEDTWLIHIKRADSGMWEIIHHNVEPEACIRQDESGNETHRICDSDGETLAELAQGAAAFLITPRGELLPIFSEDGPKQLN